MPATVPEWFLVMLVAALVAVGLFYLEEDTRGAHEWATVQANLRARHEPRDFQSLVPPHIPPEQNLGAIPLFNTVRRKDSLEPVALDKALADVLPPDQVFPPMGHWDKGEPANLSELTNYLDGCYRRKFGRTKSALSILDEIDQLCPALGELRQASASRPQVRFEEDYTTQPPFSRPIGLGTHLIKLAKVLNLDAVAALHEQQPDRALDDIHVVLKLVEGLRREPNMISGLVGAALISIQAESIWEGLGRHAWNDQQLSQLQAQLQEIDFLSDYQLCLRGQGCGFLTGTTDYLRDNPWKASDLALSMSKDSGKPALPARILFCLIPRGWYDMAKARGVSLGYTAARDLANPVTHRVHPQGDVKMEREIMAWQVLNFPNLLMRITSAPGIGAIKSFALVQTRVDCACIACATERFRLAQGTYPATLAEAGPFSLRAFPQDPVNGEPYRYKVLPMGEQLYSVGWNQIDDGGKTAYLPGNVGRMDKDRGDWVWPAFAGKPGN